MGGQEPTVPKLGIWVLAGVEFDRVSGALQLPEHVGLGLAVAELAWPIF